MMGVIFAMPNRSAMTSDRIASPVVTRSEGLCGSCIYTPSIDSIRKTIVQQKGTKRSAAVKCRRAQYEKRWRPRPKRSAEATS